MLLSIVDQTRSSRYLMTPYRNWTPNSDQGTTWRSLASNYIQYWAAALFTKRRYSNVSWWIVFVRLNHSICSKLSGQHINGSTLRAPNPSCPTLEPLHLTQDPLNLNGRSPNTSALLEPHLYSSQSFERPRCIPNSSPIFVCEQKISLTAPIHHASLWQVYQPHV